MVDAGADTLAKTAPAGASAATKWQSGRCAAGWSPARGLRGVATHAGPCTGQPSTTSTRAEGSACTCLQASPHRRRWPLLASNCQPSAPASQAARSSRGNTLALGATPTLPGDAHPNGAHNPEAFHGSTCATFQSPRHITKQDKTTEQHKLRLTTKHKPATSASGLVKLSIRRQLPIDRPRSDPQ